MDVASRLSVETLDEFRYRINIGRCINFSFALGFLSQELRTAE